MLFAFIAFVFIFAVLQRSPWAHENVYERIRMFSSERGQALAAMTGLDNDRLQAHLEDEDAWRHAVPAAIEHEEAVVEEVKEETLLAPVETAKPTEPHPPWVTDTARTEPITPPVARPKNMLESLQSMLKWDRPTWDGHWPPFRDYVDKAYDPNRWEQFDMSVMRFLLWVEQPLTTLGTIASTGRVTTR